MGNGERRFLSPDTLPAPLGYSHVVDAPARRVVYIQVGRLFREDVLVEIEAVAIKG